MHLEHVTDSFLLCTLGYVAFNYTYMEKEEYKLLSKDIVIFQEKRKDIRKRGHFWMNYLK